MLGHFPDLLYCDFDGVLHTAQVYRHQTPPVIRLDPPGHALFESCDVLERLLDPYPELRIVLSTIWVREFGLDFSKQQLTPGLRARVIGATWCSRHLTPGDFNALSRHAQITLDVCRREPARWLAVDDDADGWDPADAAHLALMPADFGLSDPIAQAQLKDRLTSQFGMGKI